MGNKQVLDFVVFVVAGHLLKFVTNFEDEELGWYQVLNQISDIMSDIGYIGVFGVRI